MNFETILWKIWILKFWNTWKDTISFKILEQRYKSHPWDLEQRYKSQNDTMNFENHTMRLETATSFIIWISKRYPWSLKRYHKARNDIHETWNKPRNDTMNFETIRKSSEILEYLVRYYEFWNLGIISMNFETILRKIPWVLKS